MHLFVVCLLLVFSFPLILTDVFKIPIECRQFFLDNHPVIEGILKDLELNKDYEQTYKLICQKYENEYRFATLYDTTNKIPVFSAYKYTGTGTFSRPKKWRRDETLDKKQASNKDYCNNDQNVNRGHLFPSSHAVDLVTAKSTFTLTNAVPQIISFNGGSWSRMEQKNKQIMNSTCIDQNGKVSAYVLTGAVPGEHKLKGEVNIPKYMWTALCCYSDADKSWVSLAHWAKNEDEKNEKAKTIIGKSVKDLQEFLKKEWKDVQLFKDCNKLLAVSGIEVLESGDEDGEDSCEDS